MRSLGLPVECIFVVAFILNPLFPLWDKIAPVVFAPRQVLPVSGITQLHLES